MFGSWVTKEGEGIKQQQKTFTKTSVWWLPERKGEGVEGKEEIKVEGTRLDIGGKRKIQYTGDIL